MTTDNDPILQLQNIRKTFDSVEAVKDLSLTVPRGVIYGLIGPNGAGKTTTIRMLLNIIGPDSGKVKYSFQKSAADPVDLIGYLPEERGLFKKMTVEDVLIFLAEVKSMPPSESKPRIDRWLEQIGLVEWKKRKVQELSKGMQQKVQFVSTVLHEPELLVLDELFSGLDPVNMELLKDIILEMKQTGTTILFSTHVMEQAEKICDYLCMISHGDKVLDGPLNEIKSQFGDNTVVVTGEFPGNDLRGLSGVSDIRSDRHRHELTLAEGTAIQSLLPEMIKLGRVDSFQRVEPSLHQIFLKMVGADALAESEQEEPVS
jgi:ABC-2 type transport system ATP-binding protein